MLRVSGGTGSALAARSTLPDRSLLSYGLAIAVCASCNHDAPRLAGARPPESEWLATIGTGSAQTTRVCRRGAKDRVTAALCQAPEIRGIEELYAALGFVGKDERSLASTTQSLGLSARFVSAANPRTFVFVNTYHYGTPVPYDKLAAVAFARGEQLVEMVALDTANFDWNFYLLKFEQACNRSRCTPEQLLTEQVEHDWTGWTLYADSDLEDTPLNCSSCHLPFGRGTHKLLLMREVSDPWLHWGDFRGVDENAHCSENATAPTPGRKVAGEGLDVLSVLEGPGGKHAGLPVAELNAAKSGKDFAMFLVDAENTIRQSPYRPSDYPYQQFELGSARVLCERLATGTSPTWDDYRKDLASRGLPVAYYGADVLDATQRAALLADRAGLLRRHAEDDALDVAMSWLSADAVRAAGLVPREEDSVPQLLHQMCGRCHDASAPPGSRRALFDASSIDSIPPVVAREARRRLHLPRSSPQLMPPLRVGELSASLIGRIDAYLGEYGGDPLE
jgi:hypothetical protein